MTERRQMRAALTLMLTVAILAGCGPMPEDVPPTAAPTVPVTDGSPAATAESTPALLTLGDLATRVNAAWRDVASYRVVHTTEGMTPPVPPPATPMASPVATPVATPAATPVARERVAMIFTREVVPPGEQRQEVTGLGPNDHEAIVTGDAIFVRGPLAAQIAPGTPPEAWIALDPDEIPEGSVMGHALGGLPETPPAPLQTLPQRLWPQQLRDLGVVEFDGRECQVYGAADTVPATGTRIDYAIAVDEQNHPCFIETSSGGVTVGRDEYHDIGGALAIEAPAAATPVAVPEAMTEPAVHD